MTLTLVMALLLALAMVGVPLLMRLGLAFQCGLRLAQKALPELLGDLVVDVAFPLPALVARHAEVAVRE